MPAWNRGFCRRSAASSVEPERGSPEMKWIFDTDTSPLNGDDCSTHAVRAVHTRRVRHATGLKIVKVRSPPGYGVPLLPDVPAVPPAPAAPPAPPVPPVALPVPVMTALPPLPPLPPSVSAAVPSPPLHRAAMTGGGLGRNERRHCDTPLAASTRWPHLPAQTDCSYHTWLGILFALATAGRQASST